MSNGKAYGRHAQRAHEPALYTNPIDDDPTDTDHYEVVSLLYRTLQCVDHAERGSAHAQRTGDGELAGLLEQALSEAHARSRMLREALAARVPSGAFAESQRRPIRDIRDASPVTSEGALVVHRAGRWFRLPSGRSVECGDRRVMRRLLARLAEERVYRPGQVVPVSALLQAGWPDEPMDSDTARNRLRVAMVRLRRLGLYDVLLSRQGGYLLTPGVSLQLTAEEYSREPTSPSRVPNAAVPPAPPALVTDRTLEWTSPPPPIQ